MRHRRLIVVLALAAILALVVSRDHAWSPRTAFVHDRSCVPCHDAQARAWAGSHHDRAMQRADARSVLGDFDDARLTDAGVTARFFRRGERFFVNTEGPDGTPTDFEIAYTFGVAPLQQYLVEFPGGRLQALTIAWDTARKRWFPLYPGEKIAPGAPLHWTGRYQNWNLMCAECHSTNLGKGYDPATDTYATTWSALNVGCQACHGPGQAHLDWARTPTAGTAGGTGLAVNLRTTAASAEVDVCARCHARRVRLVAEAQPGSPLLDEARPELLRADLYYADGQQRAEVYEYGSFLQSRMYQRGVRCTDCHDPHSGRPTAVGDALCTRCHGARPEKAYDSPAHHFHPPGSAGARCVGCHMPARTYMQVDARRDHGLRVPRPDLSARLGTPDPCTACHADRSARWAAATAEKWWGPGRGRRPHWASVLAAARAGTRDAGPALAALARDGAQPAIVRATALELLRDYGAAGAAVCIEATGDADPLVRLAAVGGLHRLPPRERLAAAAPRLDDAIRAVRIEAARVLAGVPAELFDAARRRAFDAALVELEAAQLAMADMPAARLGLAVVYEDLGRREQAERQYQAALRMDPGLFPARVNLARLYNETGRNADAERALREGIARAARQGELHYSLGLLLAEERRLAEAADALREAARLLPDRARVRYNQGLVLQQLGRRADAEAALLRAHALARDDAQIAYTLAVFYLQQRAFGRALTYARRFSELAPEDPRARRVVTQIEQARGGSGRR